MAVFASHTIPLTRDAHIRRLKASIEEIHSIYDEVYKLFELEETPDKPVTFLEVHSRHANLRLQVDRQLHEICLYAARIWIKNMNHEDVELRVCGEVGKQLSQEREHMERMSESPYLEKLLEFEKKWTETSTPTPVQTFVLRSLRKQDITKMLNALLHWETVILSTIGKLHKHRFFETLDTHKACMSASYM